MKAGAATADITPTGFSPIFLAGFGMGRRATGVHAPLAATALAIEADNGPPIVIVSLDLVGLLRVWIDRIRDRVRETSGDRVIVACTHTHSGPDTLGYWGPSVLGVFPRSDGKHPNYMRFLVDRVAACIDEAVRAILPTTAVVASFVFDSKWCRNDRKDGDRFDRVVALRFEAESGPVATIVNYASHPETLWDRNTRISPDFVGSLRTMIRESCGPLVYLNGPLGAMLTPNVDSDATIPAREAYADALGNALGAAVIESLVDGEAVADSPSYARSTLRFHNSNWRFRLLERLHLVDVRTEEGHVESVVHRVALGDAFELVTVPGELCPESGHRLHDESDATNTMIACLTEDEFGYLLEPSMFDDREYRYEQSMSLGRSSVPTLFDALRSLRPVHRVDEGEG